MLKQITKEAYTPPFSQTFPSTIDDYLHHLSWKQDAFRFAKRKFNLFIRRQLRLERNRISPDDKRILWINTANPQLGDTLMDLAARVLLQNHELDLYTSPNLYDVFRQDQFISNVLTQPKQLAGRRYDLIIVDAYTYGSLSLKIKYFARTPFVSIARFFTGPEYNRTLFGYYRINQLLGQVIDDKVINESAGPSLNIPSDAQQNVDRLGLPAQYITVALGGIVPWRTFFAWSDVIRLFLAANPRYSLVLVGAKTAKNLGDDILRENANQPNRISSTVGQLSITETATIIQRSRLLLCADGGLMHVAHSVKCPTVSLFANIDPALRLTQTTKTWPIYTQNNVNNISPQQIVDRAQTAIDEIEHA